jgi:pimeloyl-ACP methyl ester carboxylesterase
VENFAAHISTKNEELTGTSIRMVYSRLDCIQDATASHKSPVVFLHGFPDSPAMFAAYYSEAERRQPWLHGRSIYALSFPNRHDNPHFPPLRALAGGVLHREFDQIMDDLARRSPTGKLVLIAHDWGATHAWRWARARRDPSVEKMVALSVGSSFRYDIFEHGMNAFTWLYGLWFCLGWYLPFMRKPLAGSIVSAAGYRSETAADLWKDAYHYWDRPSLLVTILPQALFFLFYKPEYLDFPFPVLYMRTPRDRIASTSAFEKALRSRSDCQLVLFDQYNHWFPEQHSEDVLAEIRSFIT